MDVKKNIWSHLQKWMPTFWKLIAKNKTTENISKKGIAAAKVELPILSQEEIASLLTGVSSEYPFILGLDGLTNLATISTEKFLTLFQWDAINVENIKKWNNVSLVDELPIQNEFSTEAILQSIQWDSESIAYSKSQEENQETIEKEKSFFLIGFDDLLNLEILRVLDLFQLLQWENEGQTILPVDPDDVDLLNDLLENFPN